MERAEDQADGDTMQTGGSMQTGAIMTKVVDTIVLQNDAIST
ncbi:hypothetical protein RYX45_13415 [Alkalihalophilus pseudofirmus]|uniref:Uncharacterized protein n=1 Tax=Alkalihalophilus pseudofirmus TaxID=79885 RepID=A0AAJ2U2W5_ALKPS|nr:hypothetical protein [Alkalihalophilus pseudofirmus]MDV2886182.1 hypothetical protein [Alkalihalophilus pseudofirmus]